MENLNVKSSSTHPHLVPVRETQGRTPTSHRRGPQCRRRRCVLGGPPCGARVGTRRKAVGFQCALFSFCNTVYKTAHYVPLGAHESCEASAAWLISCVHSSAPRAGAFASLLRLPAMRSLSALYAALRATTVVSDLPRPQPATQGCPQLLAGHSWDPIRELQTRSSGSYAR